LESLKTINFQKFRENLGRMIEGYAKPIKLGASSDSIKEAIEAFYELDESLIGMTFAGELYDDYYNNARFAELRDKI